LGVKLGVSSSEKNIDKGYLRKNAEVNICSKTERMTERKEQENQIIA
jgi:hypothetical protein